MKALKQKEKIYYKYSDNSTLINPDGLITSATGGGGWVIYTQPNYDEVFLMLNSAYAPSWPRWQTSTPNVYAYVKTPKKCIITSYLTTQYGDNGSATTRICNHWIIRGYNTEEDLLTLTNGILIDDNTWATRQYLQTKTVELDNTRGFQYYSIQMVSNFANNNSYTSMGDTKFYARVAEESTEQDYDFYEEETKYKVVNQKFNGQSVYYTPSNLGIDKEDNKIDIVPCFKNGALKVVNNTAYDFSLTNYIKVNTPFAPKDNTWEQQYCFKIDYPGSVINFVLNNGLKSDFVFPKISIQTESDSTVSFQPCLSGNGSSWSINQGRTSNINYDYTKKSWLKLVFTGSQYILYFKQEGDDYTNIKQIDSTTPIYQPDDNLGFSIGADISSGDWVSYIRGIIYLDETYIKINDSYFFRGDMPYGKKQFGILSNDYIIEKGPINYNIIGTPTITNEILSECTANDYIITDTIFEPKEYDWEIVIKAKFDSYPAIQTILSFANGSTRSIQLSMKNDGHIRWYLSSDGTSNNIADGTTGTIVYDINTWYYFKLTYSNINGYYAYSSTDAINWTQCLYNSNTTPIYQNSKLSFGYNFSSYPEPLTNGIIDLKETYIKVNGWFWFGGANLVWANSNLYVSNEAINDNSITPYIDTGIAQQSGDEIEVILYTYKRTTSRNNDMPFGCWQLDGDRRYAPSVFFHWNNPNDVDAEFGTAKYDGSCAYETKVKLAFKRIDSTTTGYYIDDTLITTFNESFTNLGKTFLFAMSIFNNSTYSYVDYGFAGRIYSCKMWNSGILVRYFVPVPQSLKIGNFTVPSNGMFDIVEQKFYPNQGTGSFVYGGNIGTI